MTTHKDLIESGRLLRTPDGYRVEIQSIVTGIGGSTDACRYNALGAPGLPAYGTSHPVVPGIFLLEQYVEDLPSSTNQFKVRLIYREPKPGDLAGVAGEQYGTASIILDAGTADEEATEDIHGERLFTVYSGLYTYQTYITGTQELTERQAYVSSAWSYPTVSVSMPQLVLRVNRWERDNPEAVAKDLTGAVNSATWRGYQAKTLLCTGVNASPNSKGGFNVGYILRHDPKTWRFTDHITLSGSKIREATIGNGITIWDLYPLYDLNRLQVTTA